MFEGIALGASLVSAGYSGYVFLGLLVFIPVAIDYVSSCDKCLHPLLVVLAMPISWGRRFTTAAIICTQADVPQYGSGVCADHAVWHRAGHRHPLNVQRELVDSSGGQWGPGIGTGAASLQVMSRPQCLLSVCFAPPSTEYRLPRHWSC